MTRGIWRGSPGRRTTPEGWEEAIKRMVRLNGLTIAPEEARTIVKYLATYHGLAPEEAKPVMYLPEHRMIDETNIPNDTVRGACTTCHAFGLAALLAAFQERLAAAGESAHCAVRAGRSAFSALVDAGSGRWWCGAAGRRLRLLQQRRRLSARRLLPPGPEPLDTALDFLGNAAGTAHSGMGGVARAHAHSEVRRPLVGNGAHSGPRQLLWRYDGVCRSRRGRI